MVGTHTNIMVGTSHNIIVGTYHDIMVGTYHNIMVGTYQNIMVGTYTNIMVQGVSKKSGISKCITFFFIALLLLSSQKNIISFHKIELIAVILGIIDFQSSKWCPGYDYDFLHR